MNRNKKRGRIVGVILLSVVCMLQVVPADAWSWKAHKRKVIRKHHNHYPQGKISISLPFGFMTLKIGGKKFFYHDGVYYKRKNRNYIAVAPPVGASIPYLPYGYELVRTNGMPYYHHRGIYYLSSPTGYLVVPKPAVKIVQNPPTVIVEDQRVRGSSNVDYIELNIPNNSGGYTAVKLMKRVDGFVGPQGEFYHQFPTVGQLQIIYGDVKG